MTETERIARLEEIVLSLSERVDEQDREIGRLKHELSGVITDQANRQPDTVAGHAGAPLTAHLAHYSVAHAGRKPPQVDYTSPIGSIDLVAFNEDGEAYEIWPCQNCLPFHAEVVVHDDGDVWVREWHAIECAQFVELTSDVRHEQ